MSYFFQFYQSFKKNYFLSNIPKNRPKIHKTPQIIDLCYEWRVFVLLEMQTRYFHLTDFKRRENGFQVNPHLNKSTAVEPRAAGEWFHC